MPKSRDRGAAASNPMRRLERNTRSVDDSVESLDDIERERPAGRFARVMGGQEIDFTDPSELDYRLLYELEDPSRFFDIVIADDKQLAHVLGLTLPGWKLNKLIKDYNTHFGLGSPGNVADSFT